MLLLLIVKSSLFDKIILLKKATNSLLPFLLALVVLISSHPLVRNQKIYDFHLD